MDKDASAYADTSKKDKTRILDMVVAVTGWNVDHACQQLHSLAGGEQHGRRLFDILAGNASAHCSVGLVRTVTA